MNLLYSQVHLAQYFRSASIIVCMFSMYYAGYVFYMTTFSFGLHHDNNIIKYIISIYHIKIYKIYRPKICTISLEQVLIPYCVN